MFVDDTDSALDCHSLSLYNVYGTASCVQISAVQTAQGKDLLTYF